MRRHSGAAALCFVLVAVGCSEESEAPAAVPVAPPVVEAKPNEWTGIPGQWLLVLKDKRIFVNPDSFTYHGGDTIGVLVRIEPTDDYTHLSRDLHSCDRMGYRMIWTKRYLKGKAPTFERFTGWWAEWDSTGRSSPPGSTTWRSHQRICELAKRYRAQ